MKGTNFARKGSIGDLDMSYLERIKILNATISSLFCGFKNS